MHSLRRVEESLDPTIELSRLIRGGLMEEAFNKALIAGDLQLVIWLCHQVCCYHFVYSRSCDWLTVDPQFIYDTNLTILNCSPWVMVMLLEDAFLVDSYNDFFGPHTFGSSVPA